MAQGCYSSSQRAVPSPDDTLIAVLQQSSLLIFTYTGALLRSIALSTTAVSKCRFIRWSRLCDKTQLVSKTYEDGQSDWQCNRILLADDDSIRVYDVNNTNWSAVIERPSGTSGGITDIAFGYTSNEVLVFSDFGIKVIIWSLTTSRGVEIKDPKYTAQCYSFRPRTGHLAILTRPATQDILMLLNPDNHTLVKSIEMPTVDAQEVAWSSDGRWVAVRDLASCGSRVSFYTADGHPFKTYLGAETSGEVDLGVKCMEWNPCTGSVALGSYNDNVTILGKDKFSPVASFHHPSTILLPDLTIWQEQLSASEDRNYAIALQPANPPAPTSTKNMNSPRGISILAFSADRSFLATKHDLLPTTVWIWSLHAGTSVAVLIHHSPVKIVAWHPTEADLLLVHCAIPQPCVHLWKSTWEAPRIVTLPLRRTGGKLEANWLLNPASSEYNILLSSAHQYTTALLSSSGEISPRSTSDDEVLAKSAGIGAEALFDEGNSFDLSPIKITRDETIGLENENEASGLEFSMGNEMVDDTFHYRRHARAIG